MEWVCTVSTGGLLGKGLQRTVGREFVEEGEEEEEATVHCVGTACSTEWWTSTWDEDCDVRPCWPGGVVCLGEEVSMGEETKLSSNWSQSWEEDGGRGGGGGGDWVSFRDGGTGAGTGIGTARSLEVCAKSLEKEVDVGGPMPFETGVKAEVEEQEDTAIEVTATSVLLEGVLQATLALVA